MRLYTKYGDKGFTRLYGGDRVSKTNVRVEAYGTMDELCSLLGYIVSQMGNYDILADLKEECEEIQQHLFDCGSDLATPRELRPYKQLPENITFLEQKMDDYMHIPESLEYFIIPGGHSISSLLHMARTTTRRLERRMVAVMEENEAINEVGLIYINRLSDYFFALARLVNHRLNTPDTIYKRSAKIFKKKKSSINEK